MTSGFDRLNSGLATLQQGFQDVRKSHVEKAEQDEKKKKVDAREKFAQGIETNPDLPPGLQRMAGDSARAGNDPTSAVTSYLAKQLTPQNQAYMNALSARMASPDPKISTQAKAEFAEDMKMFEAKAAITAKYRPQEKGEKPEKTPDEIFQDSKIKSAGANFFGAQSASPVPEPVKLPNAMFAKELPNIAKLEGQPRTDAILKLVPKNMPLSADQQTALISTIDTAIGNMSDPWFSAPGASQALDALDRVSDNGFLVIPGSSSPQSRQMEAVEAATKGTGVTLPGKPTAGSDAGEYKTDPKTGEEWYRAPGTNPKDPKAWSKTGKKSAQP